MSLKSEIENRSPRYSSGAADQSSMRHKRGVSTKLPDAVKREKLELFIFEWAPHKPGCAKVNGGGQLAMGEPAVTLVAAQPCTCGRHKAITELMWMLFP